MVTVEMVIDHPIPAAIKRYAMADIVLSFLVYTFRNISSQLWFTCTVEANQLIIGANSD